MTSTHNSLGTLSDLVPWIYLSLPLYIVSAFISVKPEWSAYKQNEQGDNVAESEEELKSLVIKVKEECENVGLMLNRKFKA